jgi:hypothetical protein
MLFYGAFGRYVIICVFEGECWTREKMVFIGLAKMLRRWIPMFKQEVGNK